MKALLLYITPIHVEKQTCQISRDSTVLVVYREHLHYRIMASEPSQSRPIRPRPPRRHSSNNGKYDGPTLGAIEEDGGMAPDIPPKAYHRQFARMFHLVPLLHFDKDPEPPPPPPLYDFENILGPNGEKLADVRRNWQGRSRGISKRLGMLIAVSLLLIVGLIVGLVMGLKKRGASE